MINTYLDSIAQVFETLVLLAVGPGAGRQAEFAAAVVERHLGTTEMFGDDPRGIALFDHADDGLVVLGEVVLELVVRHIELISVGSRRKPGLY